MEAGLQLFENFMRNDLSKEQLKMLIDLVKCQANVLASSAELYAASLDMDIPELAEVNEVAKVNFYSRLDGSAEIKTMFYGGTFPNSQILSDK